MDIRLICRSEVKAYEGRKGKESFDFRSQVNRIRNDLSLYETRVIT